MYDTGAVERKPKPLPVFWLTTLFSARTAVLAQAVSFAVAHAHGFPRGVAGVTLAAIWAVMLGALLAPTLAHVVADATIAAIVLFWLR